MHNHNDKNNSSMMWTMVVCCALPFAILLFGGTALFSGGYLFLLIFGGLALACIWMMFRGHGRGRPSDSPEHQKMLRQGASDAAEKKDHSCCH